MHILMVPFFFRTKTTEEVNGLLLGLMCPIASNSLISFSISSLKQPEVFEVKGKEHLLCKLKKSLYGLKEALRQWYKKFDSFMMSHGYLKVVANHCVYIRKFDDSDFLLLLLYVDDMLIVGQDIHRIDRLKKELSKSLIFPIK
jgi:hypothetical protein